MAGIATLAALQTASANAIATHVLRQNIGAGAQTKGTSFCSLYAGVTIDFPATTATAPGALAAATCSSTTANALPIPARSSGKKTYITGLSASHMIIANAQIDNGVMFVFDRLVHSSEMSGTSTGTQSCNTPTLPVRHNSSTGVDIEAFLECYGSTGSSSVTATIAYTDSGGTGRSTSVTIPVSWRLGTMLPIPAAAGAVGFKSIESVTLSGSTGTVGNFGVTLAKRICMLPTRRTASPTQQFAALDLAFPAIHESAFVWLAYLCGDSAVANGTLTTFASLTTTEEP